MTIEMKRNRFETILAVLLLLAVLLFFFGGCAAGWRPVRDVETIEAPETFMYGSSSDSVFVDQWWTELGDSTLNRLMGEAFRQNLDFEQQLARLEQVRQAYKMSRASWFPMVQAKASKTEFGEVGDLGFPLPVYMQPLDYDLAFSAAYEVDLFGRLHAGRGAALADYRGMEEVTRAFVLSFSAQFARNYYALIALRMQMDLLEQTVDSYEKNLAIIESRYARGVAVSVEVYQARTSLAGVRAQLETMRTNVSKAENGLSVMLGRYPGDLDVGENSFLPHRLEVLSPGIPSELLKRRPDVRAAYQKLVAADKRAAEAVASRFPSLSLTGSVGSRGTDLDFVLDPQHWLWTAIGNVTLPLFEGGRRKANADRAAAAWREQVANYKSAALNAFRDVEDALEFGGNQQRVVAHTAEQVESAKSALDLATDRYLRGVTDLVPVLMSQTAYFNAQRNSITASQRLIEARIGLVTALGGGWMDQEIERTVDAKKKARG